MKMKYLVYIILTLIMASLAFGVYLYKQKISEIPLETESKPKLEWVTYNDDIYRFSFEYLKNDFISVGLNSESPYIKIRNTDPDAVTGEDLNEIEYDGPTLEYDIEFKVYKKNTSETISCEQSITDYLKVKFYGDYELSSTNSFDLNNYKVYEIESIRNGGAILFKDRTICFERPSYNLLISNTKLDGSGDIILDHIISSIKFND